MARTVADGVNADIIVLGAGVVGVSTALALVDCGFTVLLADNAGPEAAASFGNAGIIQAEAVEPYAMPRSPRVLLRMLLRQDNSFDHDWQSIARSLGPLLSYFWHSAPVRHRTASRIHADLIGGATAAHTDFARRTGASAQLRGGGYLALTRDPARFAAMVADAARIAEQYGVPSNTLVGEDLQKAEPALARTTGGAIHWTTPLCVDDPGDLVAAYLATFVAMGGQRATADARTLCHTGQAWEVMTEDGPSRAPRVVLALGAATPMIAQRFGHRFPMIAKRGYHQEFTAPRCTHRPVLDCDNALVLAPMRGRVRLTTGASLCANPEATPLQIARGHRVAEALLGCPLTPVSAIWSGVRPCMPDMLPVLGHSSRHAGLWFHFGHGHQGLTLGPVTARLLADQILGKTSDSQTCKALSPDRFG